VDDEERRGALLLQGFLLLLFRASKACIGKEEGDSTTT